MLKKSVFVGVLCVVLAAAFTACGGGGNNAPAPAPAPAPDQTGQQPEAGAGAGDEAEAVAIYEANCMGCHATDLSGGGAFPSLQQVGGRLSQDEITNVIANGQGTMMAFKGTLTDEQIQTLSQWLAAKK